MKKILFISSLLINISTTAQESLINFHKDLSWQQVLDSAEKENKLVFVDLYTDWCVPCKRMDEEVFSISRVAGVFNKRFINYKINAEKGEGISLAKKYKVDGYPYFVFTDSKGNPLYSILGYRAERELLQEADIAYKEMNDPKPLGAWQGEYEANKKNLVWLHAYIEKRNKLRLGNSQLLEDYYTLLKPADYMKAQNLLLVIKSSGIELGGNLFHLITKHFGKIDPVEGSAYSLETSLLNIFEKELNKKLIRAIKEKNEKILLNEVIPAYSHFPKKIKSMPWYDRQDGNKWKMIFYNQTANTQKLISIASKYLQQYYFSLTVKQIKQSDSIILVKSIPEFKKQGMDSSSPMIKQFFTTFTTNDHLEVLTGAANTVYNNSKKPADLAYALKWSKRALDIQQKKSTVELYTKTLYALKREQEAILFLQTAIDKLHDKSEKEKLNILLTAMKEGKPI